MNAIDLLKAQHEIVAALFAHIEKAHSHRDKLAVFEEIADLLAAHAAIEEKIFYPAIYSGKLKGQLFEAVEEHLAAKRIIADLLAMTETNETFTAKVKVLREQIEHHVEEEEGEMFKQVRARLDPTQLETYGAQMEAMFSDLMQDAPRRQVPKEIVAAAPLPH